MRTKCKQRYYANVYVMQMSVKSSLLELPCSENLNKMGLLLSHLRRATYSALVVQGFFVSAVLISGS